MSIYQLALAEAWAMSQDRVETILSIAARENEVSKEQIEELKALEKQKSDMYDGSYRLRVIDDVAVLDIEGPLFKKANMFQAMSGACSYEMLAKDFNSAFEASEINGIILNEDTPGGTVAGCDEFAQMIYEARGKKPIISYVSGMACSAGYWIGSAADEIVVSEASQVGSIGVVIGIEDNAERRKAQGIKSYEFVSSNAPNKRPDYDTDKGKAEVQRRADDLEAVFLSNVAKHRDTTVENIIKNFGAGGVEVGANAVEKGMADVVASFDYVLSQLSKSGSRRTSNRSTKGKTMKNTEGAVDGQEPAAITQADVDKATNDAKAQAKADTKERMTMILQSEDGKANPTLASALFDDDDISTAKAVEMLKAASADKASGTSEIDATDEFLKRKAEAGGLGTPDPVGGSNAPNPMMAAAEKANARSS
ncbi:S49 family peptidase [Maritalea porphyrae]|uniref:S49 family peptidase n=1 Tax=Maritalea porphyrae TaxID=880732 RepID=UPI0022AF7F08|nr:S49 family peptidase [Maritalea porphyrae]MCZ4270725.1 S49 family peptidase [Maritalea porphyrae]